MLAEAHHFFVVYCNIESIALSLSDYLALFAEGCKEYSSLIKASCHLKKDQYFATL